MTHQNVTEEFITTCSVSRSVISRHCHTGLLRGVNKVFSAKNTIAAIDGANFKVRICARCIA